MEGNAKHESGEETLACGAHQSPLETAKQIAATMCRQPKEADWLGVRMENFYRAFQRKIENVTAADVCGYLEALGEINGAKSRLCDAVIWFLLEPFVIPVRPTLC